MGEFGDGPRGGDRPRRSFGDGPRRSFGNRPPRRDDGPREMHKATCADCQQECEVPFKPAEGRPVYCKDCFRKRRPPRF